MLGLSDAEDAYQDAVMHAMSVADGLTFENEAHADSWFYSVGLNICRDRMRQNGRRGSAGLPEGAEEFISAPEQAPDETMALEASLKRLPTEQEEILRKSYFENLSHREIGRQLGISETAAKVRVHRAMEALRAIMKAEVA